ncbi:MAG: hypothetical protein IJ535_01490 [Pseudobutyrivibrio sp.]|uniref:hypothetical protein n=1 Tax=Pseudobutyrivibrio sp. TaxID=2014367 RepID=UPI002600C692|nr:hypothetical protein [Pseudobutyrivibrio sp.]MBQ8488432.1 hypothetical protein [Pseudobutyrivibrio sp.]
MIGILSICVILIVVGSAGHKILAEDQCEKEFHGKPYQACLLEFCFQELNC